MEIGVRVEAENLMTGDIRHNSFFLPYIRRTGQEWQAHGTDSPYPGDCR